MSQMGKYVLIVLGVVVIIAAGAFTTWSMLQTPPALPIDQFDKVMYVDPKAPVENSLMWPDVWVGLPDLENHTELVKAAAFNPNTNPGFVGAHACADCHAERYDGYMQTGHANTSKLPNEQTILGSFEPGENVLRTPNRHLSFRMDEKDDGFYQTVVINEKGKRYEHSERIDLVVGSGKLGQTFLFWKENALFELPVTYFAEADKWVNSPGYPLGKADFRRPIFPRCLECHATHFEVLPPKTQGFHYIRDRFILGISCERCHGPGRTHVNYHHQNPDVKEAYQIIDPKDLPPDRTIDVCAQCHSGPGEPLRESFIYRPGEPLEEHVFIPPYKPGKSTGVHTDNQLGRLKMSECFIQSPNMTCVTCHNPHAYERDMLDRYSVRCMKCHEPESHSEIPDPGYELTENCIDCHMPKRHDEHAPLGAGQVIDFPLLRDHFIAIHEENGEGRDSVDH